MCFGVVLVQDTAIYVYFVFALFEEVCFDVKYLHFIYLEVKPM